MDQNAPLDDVAAQLAAWRSDAISTLELLVSYREHVRGQAAALENPQAVVDYIEVFVGMIEGASAACERIVADLARGPDPRQAIELRALAAAGAAEQSRCLVFRDKWINKPLPHERMRPLLNDISVTSRDQLTAFRELLEAAVAIERQLGPGASAQPEDKKAFDRRALFTRLFKP
jgi:hypothetical protein